MWSARHKTEQQATSGHPQQDWASLCGSSAHVSPQVRNIPDQSVQIGLDWYAEEHREPAAFTGTGSVAGTKRDGGASQLSR